MKDEFYFGDYSSILKRDLANTTAGVFAQWHGTKYWVTVPIILKNKYYGLVCLDYTTKEHGRCLKDKECLQKVHNNLNEFSLTTGVSFLLNNLDEN